MKRVFFSKSVQLRATPQQLYCWHSDPSNLRSVTPLWIRVRKIHSSPTALVGEPFLIELAIFGLPLRWKGRWLHARSPELLVDECIEGPFCHWRHHHIFVLEKNGNAVMTDSVVAEWKYPFSLIPFSGLALKVLLGLMFAGRHQATAKIFNNKPEKFPQPEKS